MDKNTPLGPNVKRLLIEKSSQIQIEFAKRKYGSAGVGELAASLAENNGAVLQSSLREAFEWTKVALDLLRKSPGSEKWPTDEDLAGEIMRQVDARHKPTQVPR